MLFYLVLIIVLPTWLYFGCKDSKKKKELLCFDSKKTIARSLKNAISSLELLQIIIATAEISGLTQVKKLSHISRICLSSDFSLCMHLHVYVAETLHQQ